MQMRKLNQSLLLRSITMKQSAAPTPLNVFATGASRWNKHPLGRGISTELRGRQLAIGSIARITFSAGGWNMADSGLTRSYASSVAALALSRAGRFMRTLNSMAQLV